MKQFWGITVICAVILANTVWALNPHSCCPTLRDAQLDHYASTCNECPKTVDNCDMNPPDDCSQIASSQQPIEIMDCSGTADCDLMCSPASNSPPTESDLLSGDHAPGMATSFISIASSGMINDPIPSKFNSGLSLKGSPDRLNYQGWDESPPEKPPEYLFTPAAAG
jgi:hypothetical protein